MNSTIDNVDLAFIENSLDQINHVIPKYRGKRGQIPPSQLIEAILYVAKNNCSWSELPEMFGNWKVIYMRADRWARAGVLTDIFEHLEAMHPSLFKPALVRVSVFSKQSREWTTEHIKSTPSNLTVIEDQRGSRYFLWHTILYLYQDEYVSI